MPEKPVEPTRAIDEGPNQRTDSDARRSVADLACSEVAELVSSLGQPRYRARQLLKWVYEDFVDSFDDMTDLPVNLRDELSRQLSLPALDVIDQRLSADKSTTKVLFELRDRGTVEAVLMRYAGSDRSEGRATVCLSTQVGCPVGCPFCATGQQGFERNLGTAEMIAQVLYFKRLLSGEKQTGIGRGMRLKNVVFMGMGEPLANYEAVLKCIGILNSPYGLAIGRRQITISTVGLVPQITRLAREPVQVELAVSLHSANDSTRDLLVPINKVYPLAELLSACAYYFQETGRQPSFEYALFDDVNDSMSDARHLARLLNDFGGHVNLIRGNATANKKYRPSTKQAIHSFQNELLKRGVSTTLRLYRGLDIDAGCGQLRSRRLSSDK